ncbi:MAG: ribose 5-phosphate isomerase B [Candidatus Omnitrophica bacterium]|nr:ribose 5-phosphate isomerase B [Candidatus Omnitrophota bacterium]
MKIAIGSDHRGYALKQELAAYLRGKGHQIEDCGTHGQAPCDYPEYAQAVCRRVIEGKAERGILLCNSGIGMDMAANKFREIRAAYCDNPAAAKYSRMHNNANVLVLGAAFVKPVPAKRIVAMWLKTAFEGGRHLKRISMFSC